MPALRPAARHALTLAALSASLAALSAALARPAAAQTPALGFTAHATEFEDSGADFGASYVLGWSFTVNSAFSVTSLGWEYDPGFVGANGHAAPDAPHAVGLYDSLGALLASATVSYAGLPGGPSGFSYAPVAAPVTLTAGGTYTVAGVTGADDPFFFDIQDPTQPGGVGLLVDPALTYRQDQIALGSVLADPLGTEAASGADPGYLGPSFQFRPAAAAVPEAPAGALLLLGLLPVGLRAARRRRATRA